MNIEWENIEVKVAKDVKLYSLYAQPIYIKTTNIDVEKILSIAKKYEMPSQAKDKNESSISLSANKRVLEDEVLKPLKPILMKEFEQYNELVWKYTNTFKITTSWFTKTLKDGSAQWHNHQNASISGVLYLQTDKTNGNIQFQNFNNRWLDIQTKENTMYNFNKATFHCSAGCLIFFPAHLHHTIPINRSENDRYSLAFNLMPVGVVGSHPDFSFTSLTSNDSTYIAETL